MRALQRTILFACSSVYRCQHRTAALRMRFAPAGTRIQYVASSCGLCFSGAVNFSSISCVLQQHHSQEPWALIPKSSSLLFIEQELPALINNHYFNADKTLISGALGSYIMPGFCATLASGATGSYLVCGAGFFLKQC